MSVTFTVTQQERLTELEAGIDLQMCFETAARRDQVFREAENSNVKRNREKLGETLKSKHRPDTLRLQRQLEDWLIGEEGFTQVSTPIMISRRMLEQMTITDDHHLHDQVFWLDSNKCLRPMLAPNLYVMMRELKRITNGPVKIFEIGSCFRKESQGAQHMNEFTMLNFVELASVKDGEQMERLEYMAEHAMQALGLTGYHFEKEASAVYGETLDIVSENGTEIASGSYGPHFLDSNWGVFDTWVGLGIGIERAALVKAGYRTIKRVGKSISFLDGAPLSI